eukprot:PhM_4_TR12873/c0_g1_i1/m.77282/K02151/ATPeV1F, ATP6S14; V-type H+-transporting ATPase subunit F
MSRNQRLRIRAGEERLLGLIGDQDTVTGFLLAGIGDNNTTNTQNHGNNYVIVNKDTPQADIVAAFKKLTSRNDIAVVMINQHIAEDIRYLIDEYNQTLPAVLEIPSKEIPYDLTKDPVLVKINRALGISE